MTREARTLSRDVEVTAIPYGDKIPLKAGTTVIITQALGGSFTGVTDMGYMVRIEGKDADAIGEEVQAAPTVQPLGERPVEDLVWEQLRTCYDPEIPVDIVELGLVYECQVTPRPEGGHAVHVRFTLTAPGCGMGDYLKMDIERKLSSIPGVGQVEVEVVLDPPWDMSRMSDAARLQLGLM
jgi:probable FeS assembly SUF system protein SufT